MPRDLTAYNQRKERVEELLLAFCSEWVSLLAGHEVELHTMSDELGQNIRRAVSSFLERGDRLVPQFDGRCRVRLYVGIDDFVTGSKPITGELLNLVSRSRWVREDGGIYRWPPQHLEIHFTLNAELTKVLSAQFTTRSV